MQNQIVQMQQQLAQAGLMHNQAQQLFDGGLIKKGNDGKYIAVDDPEERSYIQSEVSKASKAKSDASLASHQEFQSIYANDPSS